jgi:hypothetical protein
LKHRWLSLISLIALSAVPSMARAQSVSAKSTSAAVAAQDTSSIREGFYVSAGLGYGSARIDCSGCSTDREQGLNGYFRIGGTLSPRLRLGVESDGWTKTVNGVKEQIGFLTADLYVYPDVAKNFWIRGGFGLAVAKESDDQGELTTTGAGLAGGIGFDWNVRGGNFVIVPYATYLRQLNGKFKLTGPFSEGVSTVASHVNLLEAGIGLGYRH